MITSHLAIQDDLFDCEGIRFLSQLVGPVKLLMVDLKVLLLRELVLCHDLNLSILALPEVEQ